MTRFGQGKNNNSALASSLASQEAKRNVSKAIPPPKGSDYAFRVEPEVVMSGRFGGEPSVMPPQGVYVKAPTELCHRFSTIIAADPSTGRHALRPRPTSHIRSDVPGNVQHFTGEVPPQRKPTGTEVSRRVDQIERYVSEDPLWAAVAIRRRRQGQIGCDRIPQKLEKGSIVVVTNLQENMEHNGRQGKVVVLEPDMGVVRVLLDGESETRLLRPQNLQLSKGGRAPLRQQQMNTRHEEERPIRKSLMNGPDELEIEIDGEETPVTARVHAILSAAKSRRESNPQSSEPSAFPYCNAGGSAWELEGGSQDAAEMTVGQEFRDGLRPSSKRGSAANLPTMAFPLESRHTLIQSGPSKPAVAAWPSASAAGRKGPDTFHSEAPASRARLAATPIAPAPSFEAADSASQGSRFSEGDNMQGRDPESKRFSGLMQTGDVFTSGGRPVDSMKQELEEAREKIRSAEVRELVLLREIEKLRVKGGEARGARSDHGDRTQAPEGSLPLLSPTRTGRARNEALLANTSQQQQQQQLCDAKSPPSFLSNAYPAARRVSFDRSAPAAFEKQLDPLVTLVVPSAPKTLVLASGRPEYPEFSGRYHLHPSKSNGAPLWKQANGEAWLYSSPLGVWTVTDDQQHFSTGAGFIAAVDVHDNQPPNANSEWNVLQQDSSWKADDALTIKAVPAAYLRNANSSAALVALTIHPKTRATFSYPSVTASSGMRLQVIVPPGATVSIADGYLSDADILTHSVDVHPGMANSRAPLAEDVARHQDRQFFEERRDLLSYGNNSNINNNNINNINSNNNSNNNNNNDDATRRTSADAPKAKSSGNASGSDNFAAIVSGTYPPTNSAADTPALSPVSSTMLL